MLMSAHHNVDANASRLVYFSNLLFHSAGLSDDLDAFVELVERLGVACVAWLAGRDTEGLRKVAKSDQTRVNDARA